MAKRQFRREGIYVIDRAEEPDEDYVYLIPARMFGESEIVDEAGREETLRKIRSGIDVGSIEEIGPELPQEEMLDVLIEGIGADNGSIALDAALRFRRHQRVQAALAAAVSRVPLGALPDFAQALGIAGGPDATATLRARLDEAMQQPACFAFARFNNPVAYSAIVAARSILRLEPDALDVAQILVRFFEHPCESNRRYAVTAAVDVCSRGGDTAAEEHAAAGLMKLLDSTDPQVFLRASPWLARVRGSDIVVKCERFLYNEDKGLRSDAQHALSNMPPPSSAQALAAIARWVPHAAPLSLALQAAGTVRDLLATSVLVGVARRGLASASPMLRHHALYLLDALPDALRRALVEEALRDEPEGILRRKLRALLLSAAVSVDSAEPAQDPRQPFLRRGPLLLDPPDVDTGAVIHAAELGEPLSADERAHLLAQLTSTDRAQQEEAITGLGPDRSAETFDALLLALDQGCAAAAAPLLGFLDDPRVRPALAAALRRAPITGLESLARAVGVAGGRDAIEGLRARLPDTAAAFETEAEPAAADAALCTLLAVAQAILRLDPDAADAAEVLLLALRRAAPSSRWLVVDAIVQVLRPDLATGATRSLERALAPLLAGEDIDAFLAAAPLLARNHGDAVLRRCAAALLDPGATSAREAVLALARIPFPFAARALSTVARWVRRGEGPLGELLWAAGLVIDLLDLETTVELLRRGLAAAAPSLRLDAIRIIQTLAPTAEHLALLETGADGEPDALLRREMRRLAGDRLPAAANPMSGRDHRSAPYAEGI